MKFIIRNLGWILLIIFFIFMLYLISSQNNSKNINISSNSGTTLSLTETNSKKIEKTIVKEVYEEPLNIISNEVNLSLISQEVKIKSDSDQSFVNKIRNFFTLKTNESDGKKIVNTLNLEKQEQEKNLEKQEKNQEKINEEIKTKKIVDEELIEKIDKIIKNKEINIENNKKDFALDKSKNKDKKIQKIAVKSVFLNNSNFTKRLYTAYKGDKLEQLTNTNKYGCFKVKVISSKDLRNIGKVAWTCEYYMEGKTNNLKKYKQITKNYYNNFFKNYNVGVKSLKLNNSNFNKKLGIVYYGDKLKQLSPTNKYGCFKIKVISSKNPINNGKIAWVCKKYLK